MAEFIGGTVIQRSFIGRETTNIIHIASVPLSELGYEDASPREILSELLGVPESKIIDENIYKQVLEKFSNIPSDILLYPHFYRPISNSYNRELEKLHKSFKESEKIDFLKDFLAVIDGESNLFLLPSTSFFVFEEIEKSNFKNNEILISMQLFYSRLYRNQNSINFSNEILDYDIPLGQSPTVKSDTLKRLLETSKSICIAPIVSASSNAIQQLTAHDYVGALLTTSTAGLETLILIGTMSVGAQMIQRVAQTRRKKKQRNK